MLSRRIGVLLGSLGIVALAMAASGCGCADDEGGYPPLPEPFSQTQIGMDIPSVEVPPDDGPYLIDVMFMIDDSFLVTQDTGDPPLGEMEGDGRIKAEVALDIFKDTAARLKQRLVDDSVGTDGEFDLAFGMARFEDFARFVRTGPRTTNPAQEADPIDGLARPFVLNQPILREDHPRFQLAFASALAREAPGDGGQDPFDAQSALEALYQLATGEGFDGNGDGDKTDSGAAGRIDTMLLDNLPAGVEGEESGDVPEITPASFVPTGDEDGHPNYQLGDVEASGNIGGAGWRPDSIRFVILFSDITTVTVIPENEIERDAEGRLIGTITSSPIGPGIPETLKNIQAFASTEGDTALPNPPWTGKDSPQEQQAYARFGAEGETPRVAPLGAAFLRDVIEELNQKGIEVLSIGTREETGSGPNKPNLPGTPGPGQEAAVPDPQEPPTNKAPFTWMSAVAILTGALDLDIETTIPGRTPPDRGLPLVYNLTTVFPSFESAPNDDLLEDLSDRVNEWLPFSAGGGSGGDPGWTYYQVAFELNNPNPGMTVVARIPLQPDGDPPYHSGDGNFQTIRVRNYFTGQAAPDPVRVAWEFQTARTIVGSEAMDSTMTFALTPSLLASAPNPPGGSNPTIPVPSGYFIPTPLPCQGTIFIELPLIPTGASTVAEVETARSTLTQVELEGSPAFFRDVTRGIPSGTSIGTMAGPFPPSALPYPAP